MKKQIQLVALILAGCVLAAMEPCLAAAPQAVKVEPPSWWAGHSINPVRLLVRGRGLSGAKVESPDQDIEIGLTRVNASGTYLFVDLHIQPEAAAGMRQLGIVTAEGSTTAPFELLEPLPREGRFQGFDSDDVLYLLMPDRFANGDASNDNPDWSPGMLDRGKKRYYHGGDLQGVIDRLPYLKNLGITAIWMNPFYDNANRLNERETYDEGPITDYHGYGAVDFYGVEEHFGDLAKLRELVDKAHAVGIKVVQDQVANHTGPYHVWVQDPPTPTWYNGTEARHDANNWQIWSLADPYATPEFRRLTLDGWFIDILPDLNQGDEETARYLIQNALWWIGVTGLDGIRQDTLPYVPRSFWSDWSAAILREYPDFKNVGEMWDGDPALVAFFQGGVDRFDGVDSGIQALFDFPLFYAVRAAFTGKAPIREIAKVFGRDHLYVDPMELVTFVGLHDVSRFMSEEGADFTGSKLAHTLILTARGIPVIYYGDEIGMEGGGDPDNRRDFPGGWPEDEKNAFEPAGRSAQQNELHNHIRHLIEVRSQLEPLRRGRMIHLLAEDALYAFARVGESASAVVAFNNDDRPRAFELDVRPARFAEGSILVDRLGTAPQATVRSGKFKAELPARSAAVYAVKEFVRLNPLDSRRWMRWDAASTSSTNPHRDWVACPRAGTILPPADKETERMRLRRFERVQLISLICASIGASASAAPQPNPKFEKIELKAGELVFDALAAGPAEGELVLLLHGFPQTSFSFRHQLAALAEAGYRAVAPDQRGYSPGARPPDVADYEIGLLVGDVIAMADALGRQSFHLVGHDWGGAVAWFVAAQFPSRVRSLTALSTPHFAAFGAALADPNSEQSRRSAYFQLFGAEGAEERFLANDAAVLRSVYQGAGLSEKEIQVYVDALGTKEAMRAALNWYAALNRSRAAQSEAAASAPPAPPIRVPTLYVWSTEDAAFSRSVAEATRDHVEAPYRFEVLEGVSHWVPEQASEKVSGLLLEHLRGSKRENPER